MYIFEFSYVKPDSCILYICMYNTEIKIAILQEFGCSVNRNISMKNEFW